jgi:hypothetical protein
VKLTLSLCCILSGAEGPVCFRLEAPSPKAALDVILDWAAETGARFTYDQPAGKALSVDLMPFLAARQAAVADAARACGVWGLWDEEETDT